MATHAAIGAAFREPEDGALFNRFISACLGAAGAIMAEDPATPKHTARKSWAIGIVEGDQPGVYARVRAVHHYALAMNADVRYDPVNVTDGSLDVAVQQSLAALL